MFCLFHILYFMSNSILYSSILTYSIINITFYFTMFRCFILLCSMLFCSVYSILIYRSIVPVCCIQNTVYTVFWPIDILFYSWMFNSISNFLFRRLNKIALLIIIIISLPKRFLISCRDNYRPLTFCWMLSVLPIRNRISVYECYCCW